MKAMKGKLLKKLKTVKPMGYLKQDRILQVFASDGYVESCQKNENLKPQTQLMGVEFEPKKVIESGVVKDQEPDVIDVTELMRDLEDEEMEFSDDADDKENIEPSVKSKCLNQPENWPEEGTGSEESGNMEASKVLASGIDRKQTPLSEIDISSFRRPDLNANCLFDPNLLAAFQQAVMEHIKMNEAERNFRADGAEGNGEEPPLKARRIEEEEEEQIDPLLKFPEKCPPGGSDSVVLYTTTLRGIRKTFEDCNSIRFLLESFRVVFYERDASMHSEFREELWRILDSKELPPKLFIKGRYIGGAEEVLTLHEQGKLRVLFEGVPIDRSDGPCEACGGIRFVLCSNCNGSHRVTADDGQSDQCPKCNENGLILCPFCC